VVATPGSSPLVELAQAMVPEFAGDAEAIRELIRTDDPDTMGSAVAAWRDRHWKALLVVDQFEELFTLNPPEVQAAYADVLGRLAVEHDVHVLISMRDDFLFRCQAHEPLRPVFSELTPLGPLVGGALRRALVQPASRCGYRFEDDELVAEMLAEVEGERGTLPLLAFAVNRLWEERDRGEGVLTREAYQRIGGVGGALGRHAEDTLERIGDERIPMVREIFRNLVTAQGTRAVRDLDHLLPVFDDSEQETATEVLRASRGRAAADHLRNPRGRRGAAAQDRDHPRVPTCQLAPAGALASPGPGGRAAPRRAAPGGARLGRPRPRRRPPVERHRLP
ncbi:MAG: hypothetical protein P8Y93_12095, partial [Acidobacteriota bacterium]